MWFDPDQPQPLEKIRHLAQERDGATPTFVGLWLVRPEEPPPGLYFKLNSMYASLCGQSSTGSMMLILSLVGGQKNLLFEASQDNA